MKILTLVALLLCGTAGFSRSAPAASPSVPIGAVSIGAVPPQPRVASVWRWPLNGSDGSPPRVVRPFTPPPRRWMAGHRGVDLTASGATQVMAAGPGTVAFAGTLFGQGVVVVSHGTLRTSYEPVAPSVHVGDAVTAGTPIGTLTAGHCRSAPCLHWGLLTGHGHGVRYYDPLLLLGLVRLRLEPVEPVLGRPIGANL